MKLNLTTLRSLSKQKLRVSPLNQLHHPGAPKVLFLRDKSRNRLLTIEKERIVTREKRGGDGLNR